MLPEIEYGKVYNGEFPNPGFDKILVTSEKRNNLFVCVVHNLGYGEWSVEYHNEEWLRRYIPALAPRPVKRLIRKEELPLVFKLKIQGREYLSYVDEDGDIHRFRNGDHGTGSSICFHRDRGDTWLDTPSGTWRAFEIEE